ncbi:MAG: DUF1176 domain-containing protein [Sphingomonas sp.]
MPILLALAVAAAAPQPGALKTFRDWIVGCDNGRACQAVALVPESEDGESYLMLVIERGPEAQAKAELRWTVTDGPPKRATLKVDGKSVAQVAGSVIEISPALAAALAAGGRAQVTTAPGGKVGEASLGGLAAAMRYIDDKQKRVGTDTALVAKGAGRVVPVPPPLPVVTTTPAPSTPPARFRPADIKKYNGDDGCGVPADSFKPETYRLDAAHTLVMVPSICGNGAYNYFTTALIIPNSGTPVAVAKFDAPSSMGEPGNTDPSLVNASYDAKTRRLSTYAKGRGLGDCGVTQQFAWDASRFRLVEQSEMGECRGSVDYIRTWRAKVR